MEQFACKRCGETFECYASQRRLYCTPECRKAAGQKPKNKTGRFKPCETCGEDFWVIPAREASARFCSRECKDTSKLRSPHRCMQCGVEFMAYPSQQRRYCSTACAAEFKTVRIGGLCEVCGAQLDPKRNQHRFCSISCSGQGTRTGEFVPCTQCGKDVWRRPNELKAAAAVFCSNACKNESFRLDGPGHRFKSTAGYVYVYYPTHPNAMRNGAVAEHRLVMEEQLGRLLQRGEQVHHLNGIKDDNRPENLEVILAGDHTRITTAEATAKRRREAAELAEYRKRYGPIK